MRLLHSLKSLSHSRGSSCRVCDRFGATNSESSTAAVSLLQVFANSRPSGKGDRPWPFPGQRAGERFKPLSAQQAPTHRQLRCRGTSRCFPTLYVRAIVESLSGFWCVGISATPSSPSSNACYKRPGPGQSPVPSCRRSVRNGAICPGTRVRQ